MHALQTAAAVADKVHELNYNRVQVSTMSPSLEEDGLPRNIVGRVLHVWPFDPPLRSNNVSVHEIYLPVTLRSVFLTNRFHSPAITPQVVQAFGTQGGFMFSVITMSIIAYPMAVPPAREDNVRRP